MLFRKKYLAPELQDSAESLVNFIQDSSSLANKRIGSEDVSSVLINMGLALDLLERLKEV